MSVIVPCYNYGRFLRECVESVLRQTGVAVRVLVIDDASTDRSAEVATALALADPRVEFRQHRSNQGHVRTYNEGLQWATGKYTAVLDADDSLTAGSLQRACELLEAHPEVGLVYGPVLVFEEDGRRPELVAGPVNWIIWPGQEWLETCCRVAANLILSPEVLLRTGLHQQLGGFRDDLPHAGDLEMWLRFAVYSDVGFVAGGHQACYRDHAAGMHRRVFGSPLADLAQVKAAFEELFREHGPRIADGPRLEELFRQVLARRALLAACDVYDRLPLDLPAVYGLKELAVTTHPGVEDWSEMRGLRWRRWLGPRIYRTLRTLFRRHFDSPRARRALHRLSRCAAP